MKRKFSKRLLFCQAGLKVKEVRKKRSSCEVAQQDSPELSVSQADEKADSARPGRLGAAVAVTHIAL
jgi:hypothetical protein